MLFGLFGWQIAGLYMVMGLTIAIVAGIIIGRIPNVERGVEDFVWQIKVGPQAEAEQKITWDDRLRDAARVTRNPEKCG